MVSVVLIILTAVSAFSKPKYYNVIQPIMPDKESAVVYFIGNRMGVVFDGGTPLGNFSEFKQKTNIAYKTTPGEHYFAVSNPLATIIKRADLKPNKCYYVKVDYIFTPVAKFNKMYAIEPDEGETFVQNKKVQTVQFTDKWRSDFIRGKLGKKLLRDVDVHLQKAVNESLEVDPLLSGANAGMVSTASAVVPVKMQSMYTVAIKGKQTGPHSYDELRQFALKGDLTKDTLVWKEGMRQWAAAGTIDEFANIWSSVPPPLPPPLP